MHAIRNQTVFAIDYKTEDKAQELCGFDRPPIYSYARSRQDLEVLIEQLEGNRHIEGGVIYSKDGYMVKVKSDLYRQSKSLRPLLENILLRGKPIPQDMSNAPDWYVPYWMRSPMDGLSTTGPRSTGTRWT